MKRTSDYRDYDGNIGNPKRQFLDRSEHEAGADESNSGQAESEPPSEKVTEYIRQLLAEKSQFEEKNCFNVMRLIDEEISKVQNMGRIPQREHKYVNVLKEKPIKVFTKVLIPVKDYPKFNFLGKLLGPKGNSLKRLQEETMCRMSILGKKSMRDPQKEEELKATNDPKYAHLHDELHVEISAFAPPAEAHARMSYGLAEIKKYLIPDKNDMIAQDQLREMESLTGVQHKGGFRSHRVMKNPRGSIMGAPPPLLHAPTRNPHAMQAKSKVMSILDRARVAMDDSYGYEESQEMTGFNSYDDSGGFNYNEPSEYPPSFYRKHTQYADPPQRWKSTTSTRKPDNSRYRRNMSQSGPSMKQPY